MITVYVVCEGQTEETFIRDVLAPIFSYQHIYLIARTISSSPGNKGGALSYQRVRQFILRCLKEQNDTVITTFFDLYGLHKEFPGFSESLSIMDVYQRVTFLEQALEKDISQANERYNSRFLPYIQPYEFEGLLFSDIEKLTELESGWKAKLTPLIAIRESVETPEHINNGYDTKPSERLKKHLHNPNYRKTLHGPLAIQSIGIDKLCEQCKHFATWYQQLHELRMA